MIINNILLSNFIDLSNKEKLMILKWRNHDNIRKWMYSSDIILKKDHLDFLEKLKNDSSKQFFLLSKNDSYIGVIYFSNIDPKNKMAEFGLYSNPNIKGVGEILQETVCAYALTYLKLNKLTAQALKNNTVALKLYKKFKFKEFYSKTLYHKDIVFLELSLI